MTIEITSPEVEALIQKRLQTGDFTNAEEVILHALRSSESGQVTGAALIAAMQTSPYKEACIEPPRGRFPVRDVSL